MEHPLRDLIKLENPAQAMKQDDQTARLFIPGSWAGRRLVIKPAPGAAWSGVQTDQGPAVRQAGGWDLSDLQPGRWQRVAVEGGPIDGAVVEAAAPVHINRLEANFLGETDLSVRVRLAKSPAAAGLTGSFTIHLSLTDGQGEQVGRQEVTVGARTAELAVAVHLVRRPAGPFRLKAALCLGQQVVDEALIPVPS